MPAILLTLLLQQNPDTVGLRHAFRASIVATVNKIAETNDWLRHSEHIVINVPSFLRVAGIAAEQSPHWRTIVDSLGARGTDSKVPCASQEAAVCPLLSAESLTRNGNTWTLVLVVSKVGPTYSPKHQPRGVDVEMILQLSRENGVFRIDSIKYGMMT